MPTPKKSGWDAAEDAAGGGWAGAEDASGASLETEWKPTQYGFKVRETTLPNGAKTLEREDGQVWAGGWKLKDPKTGVMVPGTAKPVSSMGWAERNIGPEAFAAAGRNWKAGFDKAAFGLADLMNRGLNAAGVTGGSENFEAAKQAQQAYKDALYNTGGTGTGLAQFTGQMGFEAPAALAAPEAKAVQGAGALTRFVTRAASNAIPAALTAYATTPGDTGERAKAGLTTLAVTPVAQAGGEAVAKGITKTLTGASRLWDASNAKFSPEMQELMDLGKKWDVELRAGDLDRGFAKAEDALSEVPGAGMGAKVAAQRDQADAAAQRLLGSLKSKVYGAGTPGEIAMGAGRSNAAADNAIGHDLYEAVAQLAGKKEAPRNNVIAAMAEEVNQNAKGSNPDKGLASEFQNRIRRLTQTPAQAAKKGEMPMDKSYNGLKDLASEFYKEAKKHDQGTPEYARYMKLVDAVHKDMDAFVANSGDPALESVHSLAGKWWKSKVKAYSPSSMEYADLAKQFHGRDAEPEKVMDFFIRANDDGKARYFYNGLDDNGRAAVRLGMVQDAYLKATEKGTLPFSPAKFATYMKNFQEASGVFFRGEDKFTIDGFTKLMRAIDRAGSANAVHATGKAGIMPYIAGAQGAALLKAGTSLASGDALGAGGAAVAATAPTLLGKAGTKLFTTPAGKRLLLAASAHEVGSTAMNRILSRDLPILIGLDQEAKKEQQ